MSVSFFCVIWVLKKKTEGSKFEDYFGCCCLLNPNHVVWYKKYYDGSLHWFLLVISINVYATLFIMITKSIFKNKFTQAQPNAKEEISSLLLFVH